MLENLHATISENLQFKFLVFTLNRTLKLEFIAYFRLNTICTNLQVESWCGLAASENFAATS